MKTFFLVIISGDRGWATDFSSLVFCFLILILFSTANTLVWFKIQKVVK